MIELSVPQHQFLTDNHKFKAYVAGLGCVHPETKIHTEHGLMRICDISVPIRVLSWNEKNQQFQLSLASPSFPKGRGNLYQILTSNGLLKVSEHHHFFSYQHTYLRADSACAQGMELASFDNQKLTNLVRCLKSFSLSDSNYSQKDVDYLDHYGALSRQYGRQLLTEEEIDLFYSQQPTCVQALKKYAFSCMDGFLGLLPKRIHPYLLNDHKCKNNYFYQAVHHLSALAGQILASPLVRTFAFHLKSKLSRANFLFHHTYQQLFFAYHSYNDPVKLKSSKIISYKVSDKEDVYFDISVMDTNNYVCENGLIHHNSGKTWAGCSEIVHHFCNHPLVTQGYFAPTYTLIRDIFYPTIEECSAHYGFKVKVLSANKEVDFYRNGTYYGTVICRTIDNPANIVGFKIGNALVDELDILPKDKAELAWNKIIARLRWNDDSVKNGVAVTTTPEGFKFTYERFQVERLKQEQDKKSMYALIKASTYSNAHNLPSDYIQSMIDTYPSQLISAYLNGEFVNMTSGSVFPAFDRELSNSTEKVNGDENIAVGMDFNVYNCSASISVMRYGKMHIVDEFHHVTDTPEMCVKLRERYPNNKITVYPDASGGASKSINASLSDLNILRQAGFTVLCRDSNPFVRDRINATNKMILDNHGERHLFINTSKCPETTLCFEQLVYDKNGAPDKTSGKDHLIDAATYPIAYNFPITAPKKQIITNTVKTRNNW